MGFIEFIMLYVLGYFVALHVIGFFNRRIREHDACADDDIVPLKEALLWALWSWIFLLMMALMFQVCLITRSKLYKGFRDYFEGK